MPRLISVGRTLGAVIVKKAGKRSKRLAAAYKDNRRAMKMVTRSFVAKTASHPGRMSGADKFGAGIVGGLAAYSVGDKAVQVRKARKARKKSRTKKR